MKSIFDSRENRAFSGNYPAVFSESVFFVANGLWVGCSLSRFSAWALFSSWREAGPDLDRLFGNLASHQPVESILLSSFITAMVTNRVVNQVMPRRRFDIASVHGKDQKYEKCREEGPVGPIVIIGPLLA